MIRAKTVLIFNFGVCIAFLVLALLSGRVIETLLPTLGKTIVLPVLDSSTRKAIEESPDIDTVRARAIFYIDLAADLKRSQSAVELREIEAIRYTCYMLCLLFGLGGLLAILANSRARIAPASS